jgi:hypothetical protein
MAPRLQLPCSQAQVKNGVRPGNIAASKIARRHRAPAALNYKTRLDLTAEATQEPCCSGCGNAIKIKSEAELTSLLHRRQEGDLPIRYHLYHELWSTINNTSCYHSIPNMSLPLVIRRTRMRQGFLRPHGNDILKTGLESSCGQID